MRALGVFHSCSIRDNLLPEGPPLLQGWTESWLRLYFSWTNCCTMLHCCMACRSAVYISSYIHVASRRQPPAPHRWAHTAGAWFRGGAESGAEELRREETRTPVRPPRFERCCSHTFATARNCQWCRPLRPKTSESTDCREKNAKNLIAMYSGPTQFKK